MKIWNVTYKEHQIRVENGWFRGERLFIDGELQDQRTGLAFRSQLSGKIRTDDGTRSRRGDIPVALSKNAKPNPPPQEIRLRITKLSNRNVAAPFHRTSPSPSPQRGHTY